MIKRTLLTLFLIGAINTSIASAQTLFDRPSTEAESGALTLGTELMRDQLNNSLVDLSEQLGNLITESKRSPGDSAATLREPTVIERLQSEILESRRRMNEEFEATQKEIDAIIRQRAEARTATANSAAPLQIVDPSATTPIDRMEQNPNEFSEAFDSEAADPITDTASSVDDAIKSLKTQQEKSILNAKTVTGLVSTKPVDKMALADNVFAAGDAATAGRLYGELLDETSSAVDQLWIKYQLAACYRATKRYDESERLLREITNVDTDRFPVPQARWWLSMMEQRLVQESKFKSLDESLQSLKKEPVDASN